MSIIIKSEEEIEIMRESGLINAEVRNVLYHTIEEGISGIELDNIARKEIESRGGTPTFPGYSPFNKPPYPGAICFSVNHQLVHGDIVSIDLGVTYRNYVSDAAFTKGVGVISKKALDLINTTKNAMEAGIKELIDGNFLGNVSNAIEIHAKNYGIIREYGGHGVGRNMHEDPHVPNYGSKNSGIKIQKGMVLAIEPMLALGSIENHEDEDQWTVVMTDHSLAAHFEETVAITDDKPYILTKKENNGE
jgi:methionyl aminopeptidase